MMFRSKAQDGKRMAPRKRTTLRRRSLLEKGLISCLVLIAVSSMLFVSTTLSWFSDQVTAGGTVIQTGTFSNGNESLQIGNSAQASRRARAIASDGVAPNAIQMMRVDKNDSDLWEPGAVFVSAPIWMENNGEIDYEFSLELLTAQENAATGLKLLDVIQFRIMDAEKFDEMKGKNGSITDLLLNYFETAGNKIDLRTADMSVDSTSSSPIVKLAVGQSSSEFVIVGVMSPYAGIEYSNIKLETPFTLVVKMQQAGFPWPDNATTILCTEDSHKQATSTFRDGEIASFADTAEGFWRYENGFHIYRCYTCQEKLFEAGNDAANHAAIAKNAFHNNNTGFGVRTAVNGSTVDYYCSVCGERIATASNGTLLILGTGEVVQ